MIPRHAGNTLLKAIFFAGLCFAVLSALESRVEWIASMCSFWGNGCSDAGQVRVLAMPVAIWGIIYYIGLLAVSFIFPEWLFYLVMAGAGVELALISMMIEMKWFCLFCTFNLLVVVLLVIMLYENRRIWQALALAIICFVVSDHLLAQESRPVIHKPGHPPKPSVAAQVDDEMIDLKEVDESLAGEIYKLQKKMYELRKDRLDFLIVTKLLTLEAEEKGLSPEVHIFNVFNKGIDVTDEDVDRYIRENPAINRSWRGDRKELVKRVREYLVDQKTKEKVESYTKTLREKYKVSEFLEPPSLPMTSVEVGASPSMGPEDASVVVFEFSDYQCPSCRKAHAVSVRARKEFRGKIRWVFKDFPLNQHKEARLMAQAARCAAEQGKFWEYQDLLYKSDSHPTRETLLEYARSLELDMETFTQSLDSKKYESVVDKDKETGRDAGVSSTPTFIVNGRLSPGYINYEKLSALIREELAKDEF